MSLDLFKDFLPSILETKKNIIRDDLDEKLYDPYMTNKALSLHQDCLFQANQMNMMYDLPKLAQYQYFLHSIRARKRPYTPWVKRKSNDDVKLIMKHYKYSYTKALQALQILTEEQLKSIRKLYEHLK